METPTSFWYSPPWTEKAGVCGRESWPAAPPGVGRSKIIAFLPLYAAVEMSVGISGVMTRSRMRPSAWTA